MTSGVRKFCYLILLPVVAALAHDVYLYVSDNYINEDKKTESFEVTKIGDYVGDYIKLEKQKRPFGISDLGYIWVTYSPETYDDAVRGTPPDTWASIYSPILSTPAVLAAAVPAILSYIFLGFTWLFGLWPFAKSGSVPKNKLASISGGGKKGGFKYKRR